MSIRCFIAVDLSDQIRREVAGLVTRLSKYRCEMRWVEPANMHLTLKFLGSLELKEVQRIRDLIERLAYTTEPFVAHFAGVGVFPNRKRPGVIWVGVDEGAEGLKMLAAQAAQACEGLGSVQKEERIFFPHLTIGRLINQTQAKQLLGVLDGASFRSAFYLRVNHLALYQSHLKSDGVVYEQLFQAAFAST
jgi:RNA 2',3'-cyclic 3'-phosphodiesterase